MSNLIVQTWETRPEHTEIVQVDQTNFREIGIWMGATNVRWETPLSQDGNYPEEVVTYVFREAHRGGYLAGNEYETIMTVRIGDFVIKIPVDDARVPSMRVNDRFYTLTPSDTLTKYRPVPEAEPTIYELINNGLVELIEPKD